MSSRHSIESLHHAVGWNESRHTRPVSRFEIAQLTLVQLYHENKFEKFAGTQHMAKSLNATFRADEPEAIGERIRGASLVQVIRKGLSERGWAPAEIDDWRDSGFIFAVHRGSTSLDVILTQYHGDDRRWILLVAATRHPGIIARWFGASLSATPDDIYELAAEIHEILSENGPTNFQWCWDDFAEGDHCSNQPIPAE